LGAHYRKGNFSAGLVLKDITNTFNSWSFNFTDSEKQVLGFFISGHPMQNWQAICDDWLGSNTDRLREMANAAPAAAPATPAANGTITPEVAALLAQLGAKPV
jgi:hypothetical protein